MDVDNLLNVARFYAYSICPASSYQNILGNVDCFFSHLLFSGTLTAQPSWTNCVDRII